MFPAPTQIPRRISNADSPSGFGFELTFRLRKEPDETGPPTWPAAVMQGLAKYVFQTGNVLCDGDHVSWHCPLDNSESRIEHMLMMEDPQLGTVNTPFGVVSFIQVRCLPVPPRTPVGGVQWVGKVLQRIPNATLFLRHCSVLFLLHRRVSVLKAASS